MVPVTRREGFYNSDANERRAEPARAAPISLEPHQQPSGHLRTQYRRAGASCRVPNKTTRAAATPPSTPSLRQGETTPSP